MNGVNALNHLFLSLYGHFITTARSKSNDKMLLILCFLLSTTIVASPAPGGVCYLSGLIAIQFLYSIENEIIHRKALL